MFDDHIIDKINFFPQLNTKIIHKSLEQLCILGILECLGPQLRFKVYRFIHPVIRTIIYEKMLFQQRRNIHNQLKEYFKIHPIPEYVFYGLDKQVKKMVAENILYYHFTESSVPQDDANFLDVVSFHLETSHRCYQSFSRSCSQTSGWWSTWRQRPNYHFQF